MDMKTMVDLLRARADSAGDSTAYTFLDGGEHDNASIAWGAVERRSRALGAVIADRVAPGARVLIMLPPGLDFPAAFFAVLYAGAIAIPTYPPSGSRADRTSARIRGMVADAGVSLVLSCRPLHARSASLEAMIPELAGLPWLNVEDVDDDAAALWRAPRVSPSTLALLQYTSGSTAAPRGVMVSHANLLHNMGLGAALAGYDADSVSVTWLPVNHDMGLINGVLQGAYSGYPTIQMAPGAFLQRPLRWLQAMSRFGATHSGGPNFAYDLCARRVSEEDRDGLDLSSWRLAYNGSEPVRRSTLENFARAFGSCGFRWTAFRPGYGLAESTLVVTSDPVGTPPLFHAERPHAWVSSGTRAGTMTVRIVDPVTCRERSDGEVGEIWVAGGSVACGYWNKPEATAATFQAFVADSNDGPFLRTGDLGCIAGGHLFVTGRIKDVLIVRGLKHYPQDIEATAEGAHAAVRPGCCAAFAVEACGEERVAMVAEVEPRFLSAAGAQAGPSAIAAIRRAVAEAHQLSLRAVALVPAGTLPKTTSGKLQRFLCRNGFLDGSLGAIVEWRDDAGIERTGTERTSAGQAGQTLAGQPFRAANQLAS
jgi:acyl-CoA synthetase (AMP-forming)/AMP-acid ligase II